MVCEKTPESKHNFDTDPIQIETVDGWITGKDTSLGADNGIAVAYCLALAESTGISHPKLELLFTVDEETGLVGAVSLEPDFVKGRILINIDSEEEGYFTVGCAGGRDTNINLKLAQKDFDTQMQQYRISISGLSGGHSGMNIGSGRANAIHILARTLQLSEARLIDINGGSAHNAIPRDCFADLLLPAEEKWKDKFELLSQDIKKEYSFVEKNMFISIEKSEESSKAFTRVDTNKLVNLLLGLPHGVFSMASGFEDMIETSNNLASISIEGNEAKILLSQRSSIRSSLDFLTAKIEAVAKLSGASVQSTVGYPSWQPNMSSPLLALAKDVYKRTTGKESKTLVIHAGLECGIIGSKYPGMDMISMGPDIEFPHCPDERANIASISRTWNFISAFLASIKEYKSKS